MKKSIIIISSILMVALLSGSVFATGPGRKNNKGQGMGYNQNCSGFRGQNALANLSQEQQDKFTALRQQFIDETYELRSEQIDNRQKMRILMETSSPDRAKLNKLSQQITDVQKKIRDKAIDFQLAAKKISPELGKRNRFKRGFMAHSNTGWQRGCQGTRCSGCRQNNN